MPYSVVVDWYGPFDRVKAAQAAFHQFGCGEMLYMLAGTVGRQSVPKLQHVGITRGFDGWVNRERALRSKIKELGLSIYLGEVSSHAIAGCKASQHQRGVLMPVQLAESGLAFFLQLPLNSEKRRSPPKDSFVLLNRWWKIDMTTRSRRRPYPDWPDFIEHDDFSGAGSVVWHGGKRKHEMIANY